MAFLFNGTTIKQVVFNGQDLAFMWWNGIKVFTKFEGLWNGVQSAIGANNTGFKTGLNTNTLVVHRVQDGVGTVLIDANGVFTGQSTEDRIGVFDILITIRGVTGGIQIGIDNDGSGIQYSPTLTFNNGTGFANTIVQPPNSGYGLEGSGFSLRISDGVNAGAWATVR